MGALVSPSQVLVFKQCDLAWSTTFHRPALREGPRGIRYLSFERDGARGPWAGVNEHGVCFVAADANLDRDLSRAVEPAGDLLRGYHRILAHHERASTAVEDMGDFYEACATPDLLLVCDREGAYHVEYSPFAGLRVVHHRRGKVVLTNHFRLLPGAVDFDDDPSTHLRLARAQEILDAEPTPEGVHALFGDQHFGDSECSICRVAENPGEHYTQAAVLFELGRPAVDVSYVLNGNARTVPTEAWQDVFRAPG
jgi:hypothetical protein